MNFEMADRVRKVDKNHLKKLKNKHEIEFETLDEMTNSIMRMESQHQCAFFLRRPYLESMNVLVDRIHYD
jgi:hypothetical protein